ncbi:MAG: hypothetical protein A2Y33_08105 [Spirochaetes bacterium GWF1_51_8]|nr:MAG: hypothetical protein A2Y33_08105 [Spirochaetes bacterium GWF1_51_8]
MKRVIVTLILTGLVAVLRGNDGYVEYHPVTGRVFFSKSMVIDMVWEEVKFEDDQFITVFCFSNTTTNVQKVKLGFPITSYAGHEWGELYPEGGKEFEKVAYKMVQDELEFKSSINGKELERKLYLIEEKTKEKPDLKGSDFLFLAEIVFNSFESIIISNEYIQKPIHSENNSGEITDEINYILKSGTTWKDPIKESKIQIKIPKPINPNYPDLQNYYKFNGLGGEVKSYILEISPQPKLIEDSKSNFILVWDYKDFQPEQNIKVVWGFVINKNLPKIQEIFEGIKNAISKEDNGYLNYLSYYFKFESKSKFCSFIYSFGDYIFDIGDNSYFNYNYSGAIRFIINGINAIYGYKFKKDFWADYYSKFEWYNPQTESPDFSKKDQDFINSLLKIDKQKK